MAATIEPCLPGPPFHLGVARSATAGPASDQGVNLQLRIVLPGHGKDPQTVTVEMTSDVARRLADKLLDEVETADGKNERETADVERDYPYVIDIPVDKAGVDETLNALHELQSEYGVRAHADAHCDKDGEYYIRWCFEDPIVKKSVAAIFFD